MTKTECANLLEWLSATWPRNFPPAMKDARRLTVLENIEAVFDGMDFAEVKDAYVLVLKTDDDVPTFAAIRNICLSRKSGAKVRQKQAYDLSKLPKEHPWRGCYTHKDAFNHYVQDQMAGGRKGDFSYYCKQYPAVEWLEWTMPDLCRDKWPYITKDNFGGWTTNEKGFCVPYTK